MKKILLVIIGLVLVSTRAFAYVMSSPNYRIRFDSLNIGGIDVQSSPNYRLKETIGEIATGEKVSPSYKLYAGYRQMEEVYIGISVTPQNVTMSPSIGGLSGGQSNGSTTAMVITDNPAGYTLQINSQTTPALRFNSHYFTDYTPGAPQIPDFNWWIEPDDSEFGFTPEGVHLIQKFRDNGSNCATGTLDTPGRCWYYFSTSTENIAQSFTSNHPSGTQTIIKFRAEIGSQDVKPAGSYQATIIVTAIAN